MDWREPGSGKSCATSCQLGNVEIEGITRSCSDSCCSNRYSVSAYFAISDVISISWYYVTRNPFIVNKSLVEAFAGRAGFHVSTSHSVKIQLDIRPITIARTQIGFHPIMKLTWSTPFTRHFPCRLPIMGAPMLGMSSLKWLHPQ